MLLNFNFSIVPQLLSPFLIQKLSDEHPLAGYLARDVKSETQRMATIICCFCHQLHANVICSSAYCQQKFHYACGLNNEVRYVTRNGFYYSYCKDHAIEVNEWEIDSDDEDDGGNEDEVDEIMTLRAVEHPKSVIHYFEPHCPSSTDKTESDDGDEDDGAKAISMKQKQKVKRVLNFISSSFK